MKGKEEKRERREGRTWNHSQTFLLPTRLRLNATINCAKSWFLTSPLARRRSKVFLRSSSFSVAQRAMIADCL
jgi:hypothetical protein